MTTRRITAAVLATVALAGNAWAQKKWDAHLDFEAKPGSKRNLGEGDLFVPLWQDSRSLLFGNFRGRFDNDSGREGNLGLGMRHMLESGWNLGGYGYFDRRQSGESGNYFNQATLGGEALGRTWDLRANAYLPYGDQVQDLPSTTNAAISGAAVVVTTTPYQERALKGFDAEVGWRVPLFDADAANQLRVYAGGYRFKDELAKVSGPRVRAELTMAELNGLWSGAQLMLGAEAQDDDQRGSQSFVSLRVRIPLGGKAERSRLSAQERRMTAPVVRDVDIVAPVVARTAIIETATATAGGQAITILDSGTTAGAALQGALQTAGTNSTVVLTGTFNTTAFTQLQDGQTLMGAGSLQVRTPSGYVATLRTPGATINSSGHGNATIRAANNSTITGLTITASSTTGQGPEGVRVSNVTGVTISNNVISAVETGGNAAFGILVANSGGATILNNTINATVNGAFQAVAIRGASGAMTVAGNTLSGSGSTNSQNHALQVLGAMTINTAASTGNFAAAGVCAGTAAGGSFVSFTNITCP
jgi:hypothetical protein